MSSDFLDWSLSLKSSVSSVLKTSKDAWLDRKFGLQNQENRLHGRGVLIDRHETITIGYWVNGDLSAGDYMYLYKDGSFLVGQKTRVGFKG